MLSNWIRTIIQGLSKGVQNVPLLTKQGSNSIVLVRPCILWLLIIPPASPLALGPIDPPSLFNCLKFPRCPSSLFPSPSLLSHTNDLTLQRSPSPEPSPTSPPGREDWIWGSRRKFPHRCEAQPCWGWHSWETVLQFSSPWLYTQRTVLAATWDSPLVGRQAMRQHLPACQEGTGYPRWWEAKRSSSENQMVSSPLSGVLLVAEYFHGDLESICPVQFFSCSIRSCILYLWHLAFFPPSASLSPPLQHTEPLSSKSCVSLVFPLLWAFSGWTWLVLKDMDSRTRQLKLKSTFSIY